MHQFAAEREDTSSSKRKPRIIYILPFFLLLLSCQEKPLPPLRVPAFDAARAFKDLEAQVAFGPRVPGSPAHANCLQFMEDTLKAYASSVRRQKFMHTIAKTGEQVELTNLISSFGMKRGRRILLAAHWDSRPWADQDPDTTNHSKPVPGANDGASGVAVLLEVARVLKREAPPVGVDIVFFDGEDLGTSGYSDTYANGARYFAAKKNVRYAPYLGILLDMVGDRQLTLYKEAYSNRLAPAVVDVVWSYANRLGIDAFKNEVRHEVADDHVPLLDAGIPCIDIIDFDYPYWHTLQDIPENCSPASLEKVGKVVLAVVYNPPS